MSDYSVMIDLETLSNHRTAAILSIGAVKFTETEILDTFYVNIHPKSCIDVGLHVSRDTLTWWTEQNKAAWDACKSNRINLDQALDAFTEWYGPNSKWTWSCGVDFDVVIIENAFEATEKKAPWKWADTRCFRTFKALFPIKLSREGTHHNAVDDAKWQVKYIQTVMSK